MRPENRPFVKKIPIRTQQNDEPVKLPQNTMCMKDLFELDPNVTYLNCAGFAPLLKSAREAGLAALQSRATPWTMTSADWFEGSEILRHLIARVFQTSADNIAFAPSASYGMATVAKNLHFKKGQSIVILERQFPSNVYTWQHLAEKQDLHLTRVERVNGLSLTDAVLQAIVPGTALVAIPNCHWMDGAYIDLHKISKQAKTVGAMLVLDLSQSLGALPIDIEAVDPDFAVAAGYKWTLGPYGLGYMYIAPRWQQVWEPLEYSWLTRDKSEDFSRLNAYTPVFKTGARKFDTGEYPMLGIRPMAIASVKQVVAWGVDYIQNTIRQLSDILKQYNREQGLEMPESVGHIVGIPFGHRDPQKVKAAFAANNISVSYRDAYIRVSPHLYNTPEDIGKLIDCLKKS
jgi:selenocysteine lyase/cysteine desulfurase